MELMGKFSGTATSISRLPRISGGGLLATGRHAAPAALVWAPCFQLPDGSSRRAPSARLRDPEKTWDLPETRPPLGRVSLAFVYLDSDDL